MKVKELLVALHDKDLEAKIHFFKQPVYKGGAFPLPIDYEIEEISEVPGHLNIKLKEKKYENQNG